MNKEKKSKRWKVQAKSQKVWNTIKTCKNEVKNKKKLNQANNNQEWDQVIRKDWVD